MCNIYMNVWLNFPTGFPLSMANEEPRNWLHPRFRSAVVALRFLRYSVMRNRRNDILKVLRLVLAVFGAVYLVAVFGGSLSQLPGMMHPSPAKSKSRSRSSTLRGPSLNNKGGPDGCVLIYDKYCALQYWAVSGRSKSESDIVTLCTQGTQEFLHHVTILCERWQGPVSVAVFCPDEDAFFEVTKTIMTLRKCHTCIEDWVDWHLFYNLNDTKPPRNFQKVLYNNETSSCIVSNPSKPLAKARTGIYPINVGRNLARISADTAYIFSTDIELYPSSNVRARCIDSSTYMSIDIFHAMIREQDDHIRPRKREVWVLPVFEVWSKQPPPRTKADLQLMYKKKMAISFHKYRCNMCHQIPNLTQWLNSSSQSERTSVVESLSKYQPLHIFATVKRTKKFKLHFWEPFFIGTKDDPEFDPRLSWEGKINKMQMAYEMCLLDYDFHILDDAFLIHSPGINVYNAKKEKYRLAFAKQNFAVMAAIKKKLAKKYGKHPEC